MAVTATDIYIRSGATGAFTKVEYVQGGWITMPSASDMISLSHTRVSDGQIVYVQQTNTLFKGSFFEAFVTPGYDGFSNSQSFAPFTWPGVGAGVTNLGDLTDVVTSSLDDGDMLAWNASTSKWQPTSVAVTLSDFNTFTSSIQTEVSDLRLVTASFATTGSNVFTGNQTIDGTLQLTTQSSEPTYISGGLYLDQSFNLYIGGS